ncbi:MAG: hypothetical protein WBF13_07690 [Candidatus Zixiibacteriota bacterium]
MRLRNIEFDLLYLGLLTQKQVKPLSRWEGEFGRSEIRTLKSLGLKTETVQRCLESGRACEELLFSRDEGLIGAYQNAFMKKPIDHSRETKRLEGELFGYPECCVQSFAEHGYLANRLDQQDQEILFHWACPDCVVTPELLPRYRAIHEEAKRLQLGSYARSCSGRQAAGFIPSLGLASCLLLAGCTHKSTTPAEAPDAHWITLEKDLDEDYLKDEWEEHFGLSPSDHDTDQNGVLDGPQLAKSMCNTIHSHPDSIEWVEVKFRHTYGLYRCSKCGETANMGYIEMTNPRNNTSICIDFLALHFMEHGSFAYEAKEGITGIVNPIQLDSVISK